VLLAAVPAGCERALDVGCGEGDLARELRRHAAHVSAIDVDARSLELAGAQGGGVEYLLGDFASFPLQPASFDFVVCVGALHHMDAASALARMRALLRPGGALAVLGLARSRYPADLPRDALAAVVSRALRLRRGWWESPAPQVWPPPHTYAQMRRIAQAELPGARLRRHLLWRYSIVWTAPQSR